EKLTVTGADEVPVGDGRSVEEATDPFDVKFHGVGDEFRPEGKPLDLPALRSEAGGAHLNGLEAGCQERSFFEDTGVPTSNFRTSNFNGPRELLKPEQGIPTKRRAPLPIQISKAAIAEPKVDGTVSGVSSLGAARDLQADLRGQPVGLPIEYDITLIQAAQTGNVVAIEHLLVTDPNKINERDSGDCSPLHWAAINNRIEAARFLLKSGADVDARGGDLKATPLHWACRQGLLDMMVVLLEYGADPTLKDMQGFNIVHLSIHSSNFMSLVYALSLPGLPVDVADAQGHTPLMWAAYQGFSQAVELLLRFGADIHACDSTGYTPLHWGVVKGDEGIIQKLIVARADLAAVDAQGQTPADVAAVSKTEAAWHAALKATGHTPSDLSKPTKRWAAARVKRMALILPAPIMTSVMLTLVYFPWEMSLPLVVLQLWLFYYFGVKRLLKICSPALSIQESPYHRRPRHLRRPPVAEPAVRLAICRLLYFYWLATTGDPGFLPRARSPLDCRELLQRLAHDGQLTARHFCPSCLTRRPFRSKHCRFCDRCVARFDHHCPWNYNCVGAANHRDFMLFTLTLALGIILFESLGIMYLAAHASQYVVMALPCLLSASVCGYFQQDPFLTFMLVWDGLQLFWLGLVAGYQLYLIARATTTNESINHDKYAYFTPATERAARPGPNALHRLAGYLHPRALSARRRFRNPFDRGVVANCLGLYDVPPEVVGGRPAYTSVPLDELGTSPALRSEGDLVEDGFLDPALFPSARSEAVSLSRH
ncbi:palmitoyltransferase akr1, partial [Massospora cicadina]